ncbi:MAG: hypothetical protein LBD58_00785 [Treponema sp.]|jgi:hypothetical protein|nr:hypothetical protein [Treponema sp.]
MPECGPSGRVQAYARSQFVSANAAAFAGRISLESPLSKPAWFLEELINNKEIFMAITSDWFPASRDEQLAMAKNWAAALAVHGMAWNVPEAETQELAAKTAAADAALAAAKSEATRTPVVSAKCREAFQTLKDKMRDIKKRYFYAPPLTAADIIGLGLKLPDTTHTASAAPTAQTMAETFLVGRHELGLRIVYTAGDPNDKANKGYRIWYAIVPPDGEAPAKPEALTNSFYTQRKKDVMEFEYDDSGKTAYFAIQIENGGKKGPWGPLTSALIP